MHLGEVDFGPPQVGHRSESGPAIGGFLSAMPRDAWLGGRDERGQLEATQGERLGFVLLFFVEEEEDGLFEKEGGGNVCVF